METMIDYHIVEMMAIDNIDQWHDMVVEIVDTSHWLAMIYETLMDHSVGKRLNKVRIEALSNNVEWHEVLSIVPNSIGFLQDVQFHLILVQ